MKIGNKVEIAGDTYVIIKICELNDEYYYFASNIKNPQNIDNCDIESLNYLILSENKNNIGEELKIEDTEEKNIKILELMYKDVVTN